MISEEICREIYDNIKDGHIVLNEPMSKHTSFKIGGSADIFIKTGNIEEIKYIAKFAKNNKIPLFVMGNGSNLLVRDNGIRGIVLKIDLQDIDIEEQKEYVIVTVGSGVQVPKLARITAKKAYSGLEFAAGIPGCVGGAIKMNAGAYGGEFKDILISATYLNENGEVIQIDNKDCEFNYRKSIFSKTNDIILNAKLKLNYGNEQDIENKIKENMESRRKKQPVDMPSAGSTFKRIDGAITAKLIDDCGLKGYCIGGAMVSTVHAGFIVNTGNATAKDVLDLAEHIKSEVYKKFNKNIELEIEVVGE